HARLHDQGGGGVVEEISRVQRLARRRQSDPQEILPHRVRGRHAAGAGGTGHPRRRPQGRHCDCQGDGRPRQARPRRQAQARPDAGRHLYDLQPRRHRRHLFHADHQRARGRHHGGLPVITETGVGQQAIRAAPVPAAVPLVGPPGDRRSSGRAVQRALRQPAYRHAPRPRIGECTMANLIDVKVPDIGEFSDVPIIEVLVKPGDPIKAEQSLITLESDKASMEVPSPVDGVVKEIKVNVGDKVSEGTLILTAEAEASPAGVAPKEKVTGGGTATGEGAPVADYGAASGVYEVVEVRVPDIGDFKDVPIIEIAVKGGDKVNPEDPLITLESDKASMEVPSPSAGTVKDLKVNIGDKVSAGSLILTLETGVAGAAPAAPSAARGAASAPRARPPPRPHAGRAARRPRWSRWRPDIRAPPTSNATCWFSAPDQAAIRR